MSQYPYPVQGTSVFSPERIYAGNGVPHGSPGAVATSSTGIRVKVAEQFRVPPPIDFRKYKFEEVQPSGFSFDFTFEHEFLKRVEEQETQEENGRPLAEELTDPWQPTIDRYLQMGHSREAICLAIVAHPDQSEARIIDFLEKLQQMMVMGFKQNLAAAALMYHNQDIQLAAETLLAAAS